TSFLVARLCGCYWQCKDLCLRFTSSPDNTISRFSLKLCGYNLASICFIGAAVDPRF
ncbi:4199_t:CDS:2, partial [Ambispora leptoticha]